MRRVLQPEPARLSRFTSSLDGSDSRSFVTRSRRSFLPDRNAFLTRHCGPSSHARERKIYIVRIERCEASVANAHVISRLPSSTFLESNSRGNSVASRCTTRRLAKKIIAVSDAKSRVISRSTSSKESWARPSAPRGWKWLLPARRGINPAGELFSGTPPPPPLRPPVHPPILKKIPMPKEEREEVGGRRGDGKRKRTQFPADTGEGKKKIKLHFPRLSRQRRHVCSSMGTLRRRLRFR